MPQLWFATPWQISVRGEVALSWHYLHTLLPAFLLPDFLILISIIFDYQISLDNIILSLSILMTAKPIRDLPFFWADSEKNPAEKVFKGENPSDF